VDCNQTAIGVDADIDAPADDDDCPRLRGELGAAGRCSPPAIGAAHADLTKPTTKESIMNIKRTLRAAVTGTVLTVGLLAATESVFTVPQPAAKGIINLGTRR
jgi:hypothetical protein